MKIFSALYDWFHPLNTFFPDWECKGVDYPHELDDKGILIIHGGGDISPSLYKKGRSSQSGADSKPSRRDMLEWELIKEAQKQGIFVFGICRGAQMLCAAAGGFLIQDVTNHAGSDHTVIDNNGKHFRVNSLHHQMQYPFNTVHEMLATSEKRSHHYIDEHNYIDVPCEPEAVYYPQLKGLALQWHPEALSADCEANLWAREVIKEKWQL